MNYVQSQKSKDKILQFTKLVISGFQFREELRSNFEYIDREICRTNNLSEDNLKARNKNRAGDKSEMRELTVPVVEPQTEAAHTYLTEVFLSGYPIFGVVGTPETQNTTRAMNTLLADQSTKTGWVRNLSLSLRKGLRYNVMATEITWLKKTTYRLERNARGATEPQQILWEGNAIRDLDLYNTFWDTRVPISQVHTHGEYAGFHECMGRVAFRQFVADLDKTYTMNLREAFEAPAGDNWYYVPDVTDKLAQSLNPSNSEFNWASWAETGNGSDKQRIKYNNTYVVTTIYARIIPEDFDLNVPGKTFPQIWKFLVVNGSVLFFAERLTNAHSYLPIIFGSPREDGLGYQTPSYAENLLEIQDIVTTLWKMRQAAQRRNISDRMIYDPLKIRMEDINTKEENGKIPVKPGSYGTDIRNAVYQIPFQDTSAALVQDANIIMEMGRGISGVNRAQEGQFQKGNRTLDEFNQIMGNGNAGLRKMALFLEDQYFTPIKEIIKYNIIQYTPAAKLFNLQEQQIVEVNPGDLQSDINYAFKMSDGLQPSSKIADTDFLQVLIQFFGTNQQAVQEFDSVAAISYLASLRNVPNLNSFRRQNAGMAAPNALPGATPGNVPDPAAVQGNPAAQIPPQ